MKPILKKSKERSAKNVARKENQEPLIGGGTDYMILILVMPEMVAEVMESAMTS